MEDNTHTTQPSLLAERETCLVVLCYVSGSVGGSGRLEREQETGQETVSGVGRARI